MALFIDGAQPFTAENIRGYAWGILLEHAMRFAREQPGLSPKLPATLEPRFTYNQDFRSIYAFTPGLLMLALIIIPTMLTALGLCVKRDGLQSSTSMPRPPASGSS